MLSPEEYEERETYCCCGLTGVILFFAIVLLIDFSLEIFQLYKIGDNPYFEGGLFLGVYAFLLLPFLVAFVLTILYLILEPTVSSREMMMMAFIIAAIVNIEIILWVTIYIYAIYPNNEVYIKRNGFDTSYNSRQDDLDPEYVSTPKHIYVIQHILFPITVTIFYFLIFFKTKEWVNVHREGGILEE